MRWRGGRRSDNVEDYRGRRLGGPGLKLGGGVIVALLLAWFFGVDPRLILVPESFTHGSAGQRMHWFNTGLTIGSLERCDTFAPGSS